MKTRADSIKGRGKPWSYRGLTQVRTLVLFLMVMLPAMAPAQFTYTTNNGAITITRYTGPGGDVTIPDTITGLPVTRIADQAFYNSVVSSVTIPSSVTNIGYSAFVGAASLTNITVDPSNPVFRSLEGVLFNKNLSTLIQYPAGKAGDYTIPDGVLNIEESEFEHCPYLTSVTIPDSVTSVGRWAFFSCDSLTNVSVGDGVTSIESAAFESCTHLISINIPNSVTYIGVYAFAHCEKLMNITFPNGLTNINCCSFRGCYGLTSVTIPKSVTVLGGMAFEHCDNLLSAYFMGDAPTDYGTAFQYDNQVKIYYLPGTTGWGRTFSGWPTWLVYDSTTPPQFFYATNDGKIIITGCRGPGGAVAIPDTINGLPVAGIDGLAFYELPLLTSVAIPKSVTFIGDSAFREFPSLISIDVDPANPAFSSLSGVLFNKSGTELLQYPGGRSGGYTIPDNVTSIGYAAFLSCHTLTSVTIPNSVTNIGGFAFGYCKQLTNVLVSASVVAIPPFAFEHCPSLVSLCFQGNAPSLVSQSSMFSATTNAVVYYLAGTIGWGATFGGRPTALWIEVPTLQESPRTQTAEVGSVVSLKAQATNSLPLLYRWYRNGNDLISVSTNGNLILTNVQLSQAGIYTAVISNALGSVTSAPAMLQVIAPVERRPVPEINLFGDAGSLMNLDYTDVLNPAPLWTPLDSVSLTSTPQYYFDLTAPLPPQRFYRAWQTGSPSEVPTLDLHMIPAITLTGNTGQKIRVDGINQYGPTDAWFTLVTVTLTNTSQLFFDVTAPGQPARLYRLAPVP